MENYNKEMAAGNGSFAANKSGGGTRTGKFAGLLVPVSCTFTEIRNAANQVVTNKYIWDKTEAVEGDYIKADPIDKYFTKVIHSAGKYNINHAADQQ